MASRAQPDDEALLDLAWRRLLIIHTPFRAADSAAYRDLLDAFRDLERVFMEEAELQSYYAESHRSLGDFTTSPVNGQPETAGSPSWKVRHVVTLQGQLMEDAFYGLRLDRFANAPDNRGWMNLFRRWGRSPSFNTHFDALRTTFTREFVQFYDYYVRNYPGGIDQYPIPHPWDARERRTLTPARAVLDAEDYVWLSSDEARRLHSATEQRVVPGVYLDSGIREVTPGQPAPARAEPEAHGGEPGPPAGGGQAPGSSPPSTPGSPGGAGPAQPNA